MTPEQRRPRSLTETWLLTGLQAAELPDPFRGTDALWASDPVRPTTWAIADRLDSIDAAAVAREQGRRFSRQDDPAMPAKPAGVPTH